MVKRTLLTFALLLIPSFTHCFKIINQTNSEKVVILEEAYRPIPKGNETLATPKPFKRKPLKITVRAKSSSIVKLRRKCKVLLVTVTKTTKSGFIFSSTTKTSSTRCFEPYGYEEGINEDYLTNHWGLVIHNPITYKARGFHDFEAQRLTDEEKRIGYGVKCVHPKLLKKTTVKKLPKELK